MSELRSRVPSVDLSTYEIAADVLRLIEAEDARRWRCLPVNRSGEELIIAVAEGFSSELLEHFSQITSLIVHPVIALDRQLDAAITKYYGGK